jgi:opacity protein-like surface antigen
LDVKTSLALIGPTDTWGTQKILVGGVLGGGFQYAFGGGVSVGAEYLYSRYAAGDFTSAVSCTAPCILADREQHDLTTQTMRLVVNYKFGE